jgi:hypothetical protein
MPFTAHEQFVKSWKTLVADFYDVKAEIIANRDSYVDEVADEYARIASASWASIKAQGYKWAVVDKKSMDRETFINYIVEKAVSLVPTEDMIEAKLQADYVTGLVYGQEDSAMDEARAAQIREQVSLSRELSAVEVSLAHEKARAEAWNIQAAQREREIKLEAMLQVEAEHAREQLTAVTSPFAEIFKALRSQMAEDAASILESVKKNGFVRGKVAERGRGMLELFDLMCTHDDMELRSKLVALREALGPMGTKQTDENRSVEQIKNTLEEIMQLEGRALADLMSGPSRFSALDV